MMDVIQKHRLRVIHYDVYYFVYFVGMKALRK